VVSLAMVGEGGDEDDRRAIGVLVPVLTEVLLAVGSDEVGKAALAAVESIELSAASHGSVRRDGSKLSVHAPKLLTDAFTHTSLRAAIEKVL